MKKIEKDIWELKNDFEKWKNFLNREAGLFAFMLGLTCLGTNYPKLYALLCLLIMALYMKDALIYFPKKVKHLREMASSEKDKEFIRIIDTSFFSFKNIIKECPIYFISWVFLAMIAYGYLK